MKNTAQAPSVIKLGACFIYESIIVIAIAFACTWPFLVLVGDASNGVKRYSLQFFLWLCVGAYFVRCWHKKGQTLAMQAWQLQLVSQEGSLLSLREALQRYLLATASLLLFGLGFLWAVVDDNRLFLHDRLLKNKIIFARQSKAS